MVSSHRQRLGATITIAILSLVSIVLLLPRDKVTHLQELTLGATLDEYAGDLWRWGSGVGEDEAGETSEGARLVVFGDSWVDDIIQDGNGPSWIEVFCDMINCTSRVSFSASQPPLSYLQRPPQGVYTSRTVHQLLYSMTKELQSIEPASTELPDFAAQVQTFLSLPLPTEQPSSTIFVVSFGSWDVYDFAGLDFRITQNATNDCVNELFSQLDVLYDDFRRRLYPPPDPAINNTAPYSKRAKFKVIIPKILDPSLSPGWARYRPTPVEPASRAEQQKNAVYLTQRWNQQIENSLGPWLDGTRTSGLTASPTPKSKSKSKPKPKKGERVVKRDVYFYDLDQKLLDLLVEHHMEDQSITDANGLGKGHSPFDSVDLPCLQAAGEGADTEGLEDFNGSLKCQDPKKFFWWDAWNVGSVVNKIIGTDVAKMVLEKKTLKASL